MVSQMDFLPQVYYQYDAVSNCSIIHIYIIVSTNTHLFHFIEQIQSICLDS